METTNAIAAGPPQQAAPEPLLVPAVPLPPAASTTPEIPEMSDWIACENEQDPELQLSPWFHAMHWPSELHWLEVAWIPGL
jgi:hypothetical protein